MAGTDGVLGLALLQREGRRVTDGKQENEMAYDHSTKIGNQGDVAKHAVLYNCVREVLRDLPADDSFVYAESHCGRATYVLPEGGEWRHGIRILARKPNTLLEGTPGIREYRDEMLSRKLNVGQQYCGSSNVVFRTLRVHQRTFRFDLFESETHAFDDLCRYYHLWPTISIHQSDGYAGLRDLREASLVLLDPPRLNADSVTQCIQSLIDADIPYVCWTPRNSSSNGNQAESQTSVEFGHIGKIGTHFNVRWADPSGTAQQTFGCRLTVSDGLTNVTDTVLGELCDIMANDGWSRQ